LQVIKSPGVRFGQGFLLLRDFEKDLFYYLKIKKEDL